jgi:hypothetical protein
MKAHSRNEIRAEKQDAALMSFPSVRFPKTFLFFPWKAVRTSDTLSAVKVAPRTATHGRRAVMIGPGSVK